MFPLLTIMNSPYTSKTNRIRFLNSSYCMYQFKNILFQREGLYNPYYAASILNTQGKLLLNDFLKPTKCVLFWEGACSKATSRP